MKKTLLLCALLLFSMLAACGTGGKTAQTTPIPVTTSNQATSAEPTTTASETQPAAPQTTIPPEQMQYQYIPENGGNDFDLDALNRRIHAWFNNGEVSPWIHAYHYVGEKLFILYGSADAFREIELFDTQQGETLFFTRLYANADEYVLTDASRMVMLGRGEFDAPGRFTYLYTQDFPLESEDDRNALQKTTYRCPLTKTNYYRGDLELDPENPIARNQLVDVSSTYNGINVLAYAVAGMVPPGSGTSQLNLKTEYDADAHTFILTVSGFSVNLVDAIDFGYCPLITAVDYKIIDAYTAKITMQLHETVQTYSLYTSGIGMPELLPEPQQSATCYELRFYTSGTNFQGENASPTYEVRPLDVSVGKQLVKPDVADVADYNPAVFTPSLMDTELAANAPRLSLELPYYHDPLLLQYQYGGQHGALVEPQGERIWFFADGKLVAGGPLGTLPEAEGDYLCYLDLLFVENGALAVKRAALQIAVTKCADYDALLAAATPRCDPLCCDPQETAWYFTDAWTGMPTYESSRPVFSAADTPAAVVAALLQEKYAEAPNADDPCKALRNITVSKAEVIGESLLDCHGIMLLSFQAVGTPISADAAVYLCENERMTRGEGSDAGKVLFEGTIWVKKLEDGCWLPIAGSHQSNTYSQLPGYRYCGSDPSVCAHKYDYPAYRMDGNALVSSVNALLLNDPDKVSWVQMRDAAGIEYCREYLVSLRINAFACQYVRRNGDSVVPGIGREQHFPQALRTVAVMYAATDLCMEIEAEFAVLLRDLQTIDPESFAYALTQVSAERAALILSLVE